MSARPPADDIETVPLDVFGAGPASDPALDAPAQPAAQPDASPPETTTQHNLRTWVEAGLRPGEDHATGLPRRLRRIYDGLAIVVLWVLAGLIYGGITLHGRMVWLFFLAAGLYIVLMRLEKGRLHQRFHLFLDDLRKRIGD